VTGDLRLLVHVYGTRCDHIASVVVADNLNGCSRLICLVLETAALCGISVRSAVYKSSYLLTYLLYCDSYIGAEYPSVFLARLHDDFPIVLFLYRPTHRAVDCVRAFAFFILVTITN